MKVREKVWVGIDVGKAAHHACVVDQDGKVAFSGKVVNGQSAIEALIARVRAKAGEVVWAVDMASGAAGLLLALLSATGDRLVYVPGRLVNRMSGAFAGEGKTDAKHARTIAETARTRSDLTPVTSPDQIVTDLRVLTARRENPMADWVRGVNHLREMLASILPALERAFRLLHPLGVGPAHRIPDPRRSARSRLRRRSNLPARPRRLAQKHLRYNR